MASTESVYRSLDNCGNQAVRASALEHGKTLNANDDAFSDEGFDTEETVWAMAA
jgi:hypothetical protein